MEIGPEILVMNPDSIKEYDSLIKDILNIERDSIPPETQALQNLSPAQSFIKKLYLAWSLLFLTLAILIIAIDLTKAIGLFLMGTGFIIILLVFHVFKIFKRQSRLTILIQLVAGLLLIHFFSFFYSDPLFIPSDLFIFPILAVGLLFLDRKAVLGLIGLVVLLRIGSLFGPALIGPEIGRGLNSTGHSPLGTKIEQLMIFLFAIGFIYYMILEVQQRFERYKASLEKEVQLDPLTNLYNMKSFYQLLDMEIARAKRYKHSFAMMMIDIDHLKKINDRFGHLAGSAIIRLTADTLKASIREGDIIARYGGDEFIVFLPFSKTYDAFTAGLRLRDAVERLQVRLKTEVLMYTISIGVASFPVHAQESGILIACADAALFKGKRAGRNRVMVYTSSASDNELLESP